MSLNAISKRVLEPEVMDDPELDPNRHIAALQGLARLNRLSASVGIVWRPIAKLARELGAARLRVLDIATGSGDIPVGLWKKAQRGKLHLDLHGVDVSGRALDLARERAQECGAEIEFSQMDALADEVGAQYDVVVCSLFLHHLENEQASSLLRNMGRAARRLVLVNDLRRSRAGLLLAHLAARLFTSSDVVRIDGPLSVKAAFTIQELREMAQQADLPGARVEPRWPCRMLLQWRRT